MSNNLETLDLEIVKQMYVFVTCQNCGYENVVEITTSSNQKVFCNNCNTILISYSAACGFIYILSNPMIPNLLKIGFTRRDVDERVKELSSKTSVPAPFVIEACFLSERPSQHEKEIYRCLDKYQLPSKEFFEIGIEKAVDVAESVIGRPPHYLSNDILKTREIHREEYKDPENLLEEITRKMSKANSIDDSTMNEALEFLERVMNL